MSDTSKERLRTGYGIGPNETTSLTPKDAGTVDGTYGTSEADVIKNNRTRIEEMEDVLKAAGLLK